MDTTMDHGLNWVNGHDTAEVSADHVQFRVAVAEDVPAIVEIGREEFFQEHEFGGVEFEWSEEKVTEYVDNTVTNGCVYLAVVGSSIQGSLALMLESPWWSRDFAIRDAWFFVRKPYRRTRVAAQLMELGRQHAKKAKIPLILGIFNSVDVKRKDRLFQRMGFECVGGWYVAKGDM